ncbi:MAG: HAD family hydrolase [Candidatus Atelocyanobacterium thalassa]
MLNTIATSTSYTLENKKALFLDRDGVVIKYIPYLFKLEQVELPLGAGEALKQWQDAGYLLILITNQAGIGRGYYNLKHVRSVHNYICKEYKKFGVNFYDIFMCPHHPNNRCSCRKPSPQMLIDASIKHSILLSKSFFIGDSISDVESASNAGCHPILLLTGKGRDSLKKIIKYPHNIEIFETLQETVKII